MRARGQSEFDWQAANVINEISVSAVLWEWINSALISRPLRSPSDGLVKKMKT